MMTDRGFCYHEETYQSQKKKGKIKPVFVLISLLTLIACSFMFIENAMESTLSVTAEIKTKEIVEQVVNGAVYDMTHSEEGVEQVSELVPG